MIALAVGERDMEQAFQARYVVAVIGPLCFQFGPFTDRAFPKQVRHDPTITTYDQTLSLHPTDSSCPEAMTMHPRVQKRQAVNLSKIRNLGGSPRDAYFMKTHRASGQPLSK